MARTTTTTPAAPEPEPEYRTPVQLGHNLSYLHDPDAQKLYLIIDLDAEAIRGSYLSTSGKPILSGSRGFRYESGIIAGKALGINLNVMITDDKLVRNGRA